jgi:hypothetical protein
MSNWKRNEGRSRTKQDVYEVVYDLSGANPQIVIKFAGKAGRFPTAKHIMNYINSNRKPQPIGIRTVERYLKELINEGRVEKIKTKYQISEKARYEIRYRTPEYFGDVMLRAAFKNFPSRSIVNRKDWRISKLEMPKIMNEYVRRFGALVIFAFLEAARPYEDQYMTVRERDQLVVDWVKSSIPLQEMFEWFKAEFRPTPDKMEQNKSKTETKTKEKINRKPFNEIDNHHLMEISEIFKHAYPKVYKNLVEARKELIIYPKLEGGKVSFTHGKSYHSDLGKYLSYLKEVNPLAYESELKARQLNSSEKKN